MDKARKRAGRIKALCFFVIFCSLVSLYRSQCKGPPKPDTRPILESGQLVAQETLNLVGNRGEIVVVAMATDYGKLQLKAFRQTLPPSA